MVTAGFSQLTAATVPPKQYSKHKVLTEKNVSIFLLNKKNKIQSNLNATLPATATQLQPSLYGKQSDSDQATQHYSSRSVTERSYWKGEMGGLGMTEDENDEKSPTACRGVPVYIQRQKKCD